MFYHSFKIIFPALIFCFYSCAEQGTKEKTAPRAADTLKMPDIHNTPVNSAIGCVTTQKEFSYKNGQPEEPGKLISTEELDKNGRIIKASYYNNGAISSYNIISRSASGKELNNSRFNSAGILIAKQTFTYNANDSVIKTQIHSAPLTVNGLVGEPEFISETEIKYQGDGKKSYVNNKYIENNYFDCHEYIYDGMGNVIKDVHTVGKNDRPRDSAHCDIYCTKYDMHGNKRSWIWLSGKDTVSVNRFIYKYSKDSLVEKCTEKGRDEKEWQRLEFKYGSLGNILEKKVYSSAANKADLYTYYENGKVKTHKNLEHSFSYIPAEKRNRIDCDTLSTIFDEQGSKIGSCSSGSDSKLTQYKMFKYDSEGRVSEIRQKDFYTRHGKRPLINNKTISLNDDDTKLTRITYEMPEKK